MRQVSQLHQQQLDEFDPLAEMMAMKEQEEKEKVDYASRRTIWKMNYSMKKDQDKKDKKLDIISNDLLPNI